MNRAPGRLFVLCAWLALFLVAAKAWYLLEHATPPEASADYLRGLAAVSYTDVFLLALGWLLLRIAIALLSPARASVLVFVCYALAAVAVWYAVVNVALFDSFGGYLTASLLALLPRVAFLKSAAAERLTAGVFVLAAVAAALYLALAALALRPRRHRTLAHRVLGVGTAAVLAGGWIAVGAREYRAHWAGFQDHRAAESAHWQLARSTWQALGRGLVIPREPIRDDDLRDFAPAPAEAAQSALASRPNVIVIVLESVAARWTSISGGAYATTPELAREARGGTAFDAAYAHVGRSSDALAAILLSRYPKLDFRDITNEYPRLAGTSLAALFHDRGYATTYATSSDFAWANWRQFLDGRGFDRLIDDHALSCTEPLSEWGVEDRCLVDALIADVDAARGQPFFLMAWTGQTHYPYELAPGAPVLDLTREPGPDAWDLNRYLNVLHETDRQLGRLFDVLDALDLERRTLVVILGDHGQAFGFPHPSYSQGRTAYEEDVHIPLVIRGPGVREAVRSEVIGAQVDVAPTIAALAGLPPAPDWQGRSLFAENRPPRAYFFVAEDRFTLGVRDRGFKYLWDLREGTEELYDLGADPTEQRNLAGAEPARARDLRRRLAAWMEANRRSYRN